MKAKRPVCPDCGDDYPDLPHLTCARARDLTELIVGGWVPLLGEARSMYLTRGRGEAVRYPTLAESLAATDRPGVPLRPTFALHGVVFGEAALAAPMVTRVELHRDRRNWLAFPPSAVRNALPGSRLLASALFGAERVRAVGWHKAREEASFGSWPPRDPWAEPYVTTGADPGVWRRFAYGATDVYSADARVTRWTRRWDDTHRWNRP